MAIAVVNLSPIFLQASLAEDLIYNCRFGTTTANEFRVDRANRRVVSLAGDQETKNIKEKNGVIRLGSYKLDTRKKVMTCGFWLMADTEATCTTR